MKKYILVLNAGSATLKFKIFDYASLKEKIAGNFERIGLAHSFLVIGQRKWNFGKVKNNDQALEIILKRLQTNDYGLRLHQIKAIGHRVVHGGEEFFKPVVVTSKVWQKISRYNRFVPLHNPVNLAVIKACYKIFPNVKNVAVFDTGFYHDLRPEQYLYALPLSFYKHFGIRKYGFHGISHQYVTSEAARLLKRPLTKLNLITCHLGNGCSVVAIKNGKPIDTSLGFTALSGLVMGTRCGDVDPGLPIFLQKDLKISPDRVYELMYKKSGLLGLSGFTSDMREILKAAGYQVINYHGMKNFSKKQKERAKLALAIFINRLRFYICAYAGLLGRVDAIIFTGGIGERSPVIRKLALASLSFIKKPRVLVINTDEEREIAAEIKKFV